MLQREGKGGERGGEEGQEKGRRGEGGVFTKRRTEVMRIEEENDEGRMRTRLEKRIKEVS